VYELPALMAKGVAVVTVPVRVRSPGLMTENVCVLVAPTVTCPKSRPSGLMTSWGGFREIMYADRVLVLTPRGPSR